MKKIIINENKIIGSVSALVVCVRRPNLTSDFEIFLTCRSLIH